MRMTNEQIRLFNQQYRQIQEYEQALRDIVAYSGTSAQGEIAKKALDEAKKGKGTQ